MMKSLRSHGSHSLNTLVINLFYFAFFGLSDLTEANQEVVSITRHYQGDLYYFKESGPKLPPFTCECGPGSFQVGPAKDCQCQCLKEKPTLRDDTLECVSDLQECMLAEFVSSTQAEKIPYVYIPNNGQFIHPTAEIALLGLNHGESLLVSPICIVTSSQFLSQNGWQDMRNSTTFEAPFRLHLDSGKTYLQWTGESVEKLASEGRVILIQLLCRDAGKSRRTLFHPCLSFRVAGSPDAKELLSFKDTLLTKEKALSTGESLAIGLVLGGLVVAYILVSLIYWRVKQNNGELFKITKSNPTQMEEGTSPKKYMTRNDEKEESTGTLKKANTLAKTSLVSSEDDSDCDDLEDLSKKPKPSNKKENGSVTTVDVHDDEEDIYSIPSELEEKEGRRLRLERLKMEMQTQSTSERNIDEIKYEISGSAFGFSVAETFESTGIASRSLSVIKPNDTGDTDEVDNEENDTHNKKKLYFNPAYFEPENLQSPPPAAVEFLSKIREMISAAKNKMQTKAFQPNLIDIPEDDYSLQASRAPSTTSNVRTSSQQTFTLEELEEQDPIYSVADDTSCSNILEVIPTEKDNRSNTLKRLSQRVNTHGQTLVSEIIQTLDLKPRLPDAYYNPYPSTIPSEPAPPRPDQTPVNATKEVVRKSEPVFPDLIKPSMLRHALNKDAKNSPESANTFENFRQEIRATLNKVKTISPMSSLNRNKNKNSNDVANTKNSEQGENKVQKWLQSLDGKNNPYSKIYDAVSSGFGSKPIQVNSLEENKPRIPTRTVSFSHMRQLTSPSIGSESPISLLTGDDSKLKTNVKKINDDSHKNLPSVYRSHSLLKDHVVLNSFQRRQRNSMMDENKNTINHFVNNAISKVPKMDSSDTDSIHSETQSRYKDSLECNNLKQGQQESINDLDRSSNSASPLTIREETNVNTNGTGIYGNPFHSDHEIAQENSYEEITFGSNSKTKTAAALKINDARVKKHVKEIRVGVEEPEDGETKCGMYSNPDSLISEIHITGENIIGIHSSDNRLSIELTDNTLSSDSDNREPSNASEKKKKKSRKVKRNDSILQDSLERPKIKKKTSEERSHSFRKEENESEITSLTKEEENNNNTNNNSHINSIIDKEDPTKVKRSKTLRTFKDYQAIKFSFKNTNNNKLSVVGEGIHFTYRTPSPSEASLSSLSTISTIHKPPLPPKQLKCYEDSLLKLENASNPNEHLAPIIPPKHKLRYSASLVSDLHRNSLITLSTIPDIAPKLPPKIKHRNSFSDVNNYLHGISKIVNQDDKEPPKLPEKSRKRSNSLLSNSSSRSSIPELTEDEARSILHGVLAHSSSLDSSISESIYSQGQNFLDNGNIANDSDYTFIGNVPDNLSEQLLNSEDEYESIKENGKVPSPEQNSIDLFAAQNENEVFGEEVIRGQFILSNSRPPTLQRQSSLNRETNVMAHMNEMTTSLHHSDKIIDGTLALKIKAELERHFIEKSGADSIKRTWRKVLEKVDSNEKLTLKDLQKYVLSLRSNQVNSKAKNEDSGYHSSTDSSESSRIHKARLNESYKSINFKPYLKRSGTIAIPSGLRKKTVNFFHRSSSLQHLIPGSLDISILRKDSFKFNRNKLTSSMERRKDVNPRLSVYINDSFSSDLK